MGTVSRLLRSAGLKAPKQPKKKEPRPPATDEDIKEAVAYTQSIFATYDRLFRERGISIEGRSYLEIGPGRDFGPQLLMVDRGASVTVADRFYRNGTKTIIPRFTARFCLGSAARRPQSGSSTNPGMMASSTSSAPRPRSLARLLTARSMSSCPMPSSSTSTISQRRHGRCVACRRREPSILTRSISVTTGTSHGLSSTFFFRGVNSRVCSLGTTASSGARRDLWRWRGSSRRPATPSTMPKSARTQTKDTSTISSRAFAARGSRPTSAGLAATCEPLACATGCGRDGRAIPCGSKGRGQDLALCYDLEDDREMRPFRGGWLLLRNPALERPLEPLPA